MNAMNALFKFLEIKQRQKEFKKISKMNPDNLADAITKYFPDIKQSWQIEAANKLSYKTTDLVKKHLKYCVNINEIKEYDTYGVSVRFNGFQIFKIFQEK